MKRYIGNTGKVIIIDDGRPPETTDSLPDRNEYIYEAVPLHAAAQRKSRGGDMFHRPLFGFEAGDIAVIALMFLLYKESGDEEFLIVLAFFALGIFNK